MLANKKKVQAKTSKIKGNARAKEVTKKATVKKPKEELNIKSVSVVSRRSAKVGNDFFTFECAFEADAGNDTDFVLESLWAKANEEVDKQFENTIHDLQS